MKKARVWKFFRQLDFIYLFFKGIQLCEDKYGVNIGLQFFPFGIKYNQYRAPLKVCKMYSKMYCDVHKMCL